MIKRLIAPFLFFLFLFLLLALIEAPQEACAEDPPEAVHPAQESRESGFNVGLWLISFYRNTISTVDGDRCPSLPSCSSYSAEAFRKHGFFLGWMMTVDRLIHEGKEETKVSPTVLTPGGWKIYDPVENNDFWWYSPDRKGHD